FILSLVFGFLNPFFYDSSYRLGQGADFYAFYQAGYNIIVGLNPYEKIPGYIVVPYSYNYRYLPFFAYTFGIGFNIFPPLIAYWIWVIIILALIWYTCWLTLKICNTLEKPKWIAYVAIGMWLCFSPIYLELYMGQTTLFVGLLTFFSFYAEMRKKETHGTILWTLASLLKLMPYLLTPGIISSGRTRKVIINIIFTIIAIFSFSIILFLYFFNYNLEQTGKFFAHLGSFDLKNLIYIIGNVFTSNDHWFLNNNSLINIILLTIFFGLAMLTTLYSKDYLVSLSLFACVYFLAFSGIWEHHYTFLLPFIILLWMRDNKRLKWFLIFLFLALPTPFFIFDMLNLWDFPFLLLYKCSKSIPTLILFIILLKEAYKSPRQEKFIDSLKEVSKSIYIGFKEPKIDKLPNVFLINKD
ncbi:MAG: glycosyltransferase family 87 protein, partial [Promethearchaeota archaeon]